MAYTLVAKAENESINCIFCFGILFQGKTITLKLKNVKFEVKSRACTLPCAVATADDIFAAAKDLLKTEIDNISPQQLRLRLMGNGVYRAAALAGG